MLRLTTFAAACLMPALALAAGGESNTAPSTTNTSTTCAAGKVWDVKTKTCLDVKSEALDNDTLFDAVRELAYAGRPDSAALALAAMTEGDTDRVMTYRGFLARVTGDMDAAMAFYTAALALNPDNVLARSYMAQGFVALGRMDAAEAELAEIRARGGIGTWAEASLVQAIERGATFRY
ncbi:MAG: tetratricopeptide repeat protein [Gemmobacter sp.]